MLLKNLFVDFPLFVPTEIPVVEISGIVIDSRAVKRGDLFVAMRGRDADGHDYIQNAIENGASAIVGDREMGELSVPYLRLENARHALTWLAAAFYGFPARKLTVVGVTGTDGKTTTSELLYQILLTANLKAGLISTVKAVIGDETLDTGFHVTTPDAHDVQRYLAQMVAAGLTHVVLETTSHGWAQRRVDACEFDVGIATNITHEHMDEHGGYENYRAAKARLFESLAQTRAKPQGNPRLGVINFDDEKSFGFLNDLIQTKKVNYGLNEGAEVRGADVRYDSEGIHFMAKSADFRVDVSSHLAGAYNVSNCLAALTAAVYGLGVSPEIAARGVADLRSIPGRMERINLGQPFAAIVDFAHTPNALKSALQAARTMTSGRVIVAFGSAGLRDKEKRRMMAETSAELADLTVLTAEDPRVESLDAILAEMAAGMKSRGGREGETFWRVADRGAAIKFALSLARAGDVVLACGKGHEQSMCFGKTEYLWDDRTATRAALSDLLGAKGEAMPYLPTQDQTEEEWLKA
ncbi:MAG: UDP-N-acetylmuramoyl-L-alanyl-D-glutamate--2,6-diaminopimelate ligase [Anaerolineales bacterium]|nr:UDP-N-acetylmuramoyl-L-alanyl-D-glutamate--2,6-diaminopimelate ligase [Anaerolineales bacterium]